LRIATRETDIDHVAHRAHVDTSEHHISRQAACTSDDIYSWGQRTLTEDLNKALELEAADMAAGKSFELLQKSSGTFWEGRRSPKPTTYIKDEEFICIM
jgi:hypothetical protein